MAKLLPSARLILITRDPVERLNSAFYQCHRSHGQLRSSVRRTPSSDACDGLEATPCGFVKGLTKVLCDSSDIDDDDLRIEINSQYFERMNPEARMDNFWTRHLAMGLHNYSVYMNRWLEYFPTSQILRLRQDEFTSDPFRTLDRIMDFLQLERFDYRSIAKHNGKYWTLGKQGKREKEGKVKYPLDPIARKWLESIFS